MKACEDSAESGEAYGKARVPVTLLIAAMPVVTGLLVAFIVVLTVVAAFM